MRWIVVGSTRSHDGQRQGCGPILMAVDAPDLRMGALGHGCLDPGRVMFSTEAFDPAAHETPETCVAEACVIGEGAVAREMVRRLVALGARTHTIAATVEEHAAALEVGACPRRAEDLSALMPRLDIVLSTGRAFFVDARLLSRLSQKALIVDFAGPPGSVDFEFAKHLGLEVVWARRVVNSLSTESATPVWDVIGARVDKIATTRSASK